MNGTTAKFVDYNLKDPRRHHICNFDLRSIVHRQYVLMYIYSIATCQISRVALRIAVRTKDLESFRMAAILLGYILKLLYLQKLYTSKFYYHILCQKPK